MPARFYAFREDLVPWSLSDPVVLSGALDCRYWAETFQRLVAAYPALDFRAVVTTRLDALPLVGPDVVVVVLNDELVRIPTYAHQVGLVLKPAGVRLPWQLPTGPAARWPVAVLELAQQARLQLRRAPSYLRSGLRTVRTRSRPRQLDVPFGTFALEPVPYVPFADRTFDVWFRGSFFHTDEERRGLRRWVTPLKTRYRRECIRSVHGLFRDRPDLRVHLTTVRSFYDNASLGIEYSETLMQSRVALCPRGAVIDTYRHYEALASGCIVVADALPRREFYGGAPIVDVGAWARLPQVLERLFADPARLHEMHEAGMRWWQSQAAPAATARRIARALGAAGG